MSASEGNDRKTSWSRNSILIFAAVLVSFLMSTTVAVWSLTRMARDNTKEIDMMLTARIYDIVSSSVNEPITVARTMANNRFLIDTLKNEAAVGEEATAEILRNYISSLETGLNYKVAFVISDRSKRYYTDSGLFKTVSPEKEARDIWYPLFLSANEKYNVNVGRDEVDPNQWTVFVNVRLEDEGGNLLGVCGVGVRMANLQTLFEELEKKYDVKINLVDENGLVQVDTDKINIERAYLRTEDISPEKSTEYVYHAMDSGEFTVTKYVEHLGWYLVIRSSGGIINREFIHVILFNVALSLLVMVIILAVLQLILRQSSRKTQLAERLNQQLSSAADIYRSAHDIDIINDTFVEILTNNKIISDLIGDNRENAQQTLLAVMDSLTDPVSKDEIRTFVDFSTIDERMMGRKTITTEFLNIEKLWFRGRFIVSQRTPEGRISHLLWVVEDIDEEKRKREMLYETAQKLNSQISSIANIYMTMYEMDIVEDTFVEIRAKNKAVTDIIGESRVHANATLRKVMERLTHESALQEVLRFVDLTTLGERMRDTDTLAVEYPNWQKLWRRGRFIAFRRDEAGKLLNVLWLVTDIDQEKKYRDSLIDMSERAIAASEAKSSFLSSMSHEIRTPINAVLGMNEMILRECGEKNILAYSESIRTAGNTLLELVNDILDFSKIEAGKMEIVPADYDLSSVINDLVNMVRARAKEKGLVLALDFDGQLPRRLNGDAVRLKQVITNLLTNAVKYTEKGSVVFSIGFERIASEPDSVLLNVAVKDTGIGIRQEDMEKLFAEFERVDLTRNRNIEGTGLGLSITKSLLAMMGTSLKVDSVYGLGSKFYFSLKQRVISWEELGDYETSWRETLEGRARYRARYIAPEARVLVVDDNPINLFVFENLLKKTRVGIELAGSGDEGLAMAREKRYDVIFLDHMMPDKDGIETLHELRQEDGPNRETPVVCLTANVISGAREEYIAQGFDDYLSKPIDPETLEDMLLRYLPQEKVKPAPETDGDEPEAEEGVLPEAVKNIAELDIDTGIGNNSGEAAYLEALKVYAELADRYADEIEGYRAAGDLRNATIKIHALKSTSRIIGATELGALAQRLEAAGKNGDAEALGPDLDELLGRCRRLGARLVELLGGEAEAPDDSLPTVDAERLRAAYGRIREFASDRDDAAIEETLESLEGYRVPEDEEERFRAVKQALEEFDFDKILGLLKEEH